jgi:hypothetical protein
VDGLLDVVIGQFFFYLPTAFLEDQSQKEDIL